MDGNFSRQRQEFATFGSRTWSCRRGYPLNKIAFTIEEIAQTSEGTGLSAFASMTRAAPITRPRIPMKRVYINSTAREMDALISIAYLTLYTETPRAVSSILLKRHRDSSCFGIHRESPPAILTRRPRGGAGTGRGEQPCFRNRGIQTTRGWKSCSRDDVDEGPMHDEVSRQTSAGYCNRPGISLHLQASSAMPQTGYYCFGADRRTYEYTLCFGTGQQSFHGATWKRQF